MLALALPLVAAEIGWMSMGIVDTIMVGHLPNAAVAISSVALAQVFYNTLAFGIAGMLLGLDTVLSQAHGAGEIDEANLWLLHGLALAGGLAIALTVVFALAPLGLAHLRADPVVRLGAMQTLQALNLGTVPLLLYFALRRYLQAFNHVRFIAATLVSANLVNLLFDWLLIYGHHWTVHLGPTHHLTLRWAALGIVGSGLATALARLYQAVFLIAAILFVNRRHSYGLLQTRLRPGSTRVRQLLALGAPAGTTIFVEIAIFAVVTFLISTLGPIPLAGHELALTIISFTFMIPLGISAAASVRVGQEVGRQDLPAARAAGWTAIALSAGFMLFSAAAFLLFPALLLRAFTRDPLVIAAGVPLLFIAALFQFFDGVQITVIGALRGAGDTLSGLLTHLCSYWIFGLPLGVYLCFSRKLGARGLWIGLCAALIVTGIVLLLRWRRNPGLQDLTGSSDTTPSKALP